MSLSKCCKLTLFRSFVLHYFSGELIIALRKLADAICAGIFPATPGADVVDTAEKGHTVKIRAEPIRIFCHVVRPGRIVFVKTFFHFFLRQCKLIRATVSPAQ